MNSKDKKDLQALLHRIRGVSATAATMDGSGKYVSYHQEATRLMDSKDYRAGYERCYSQVVDFLATMGITEVKGDQ